MMMSPNAPVVIGQYATFFDRRHVRAKSATDFSFARRIVDPMLFESARRHIIEARAKGLEVL
ncbi:MAG: hypothetical protein MZU79_02630 [Anaerotruncus sp.]|nr:hypothetical protein [Anaerotruncus sp.]